MNYVQYVLDHWKQWSEVLATIYGLLNVLNATMKEKPKATAARRALRRMSITTSRNHPWHQLKVPLVVKGNGANSVLIFAFVGLGLTSCRCWQPEHAQEPACVIAHQTVDCATGNTGQIAGVVAPLLMDLLNGGATDWDGVLGRLEGLGFKDAGCILAALESDLLGKAKASPALMPKIAAAHSAFESWKAKHGAVNVTFKVKK